MKHVAVTYLAAVFVVSFVTFVTYGLDKWSARNGGRRVPENTLHLLVLLGGWPGALLGQRIFRHKTQKVRYRIVFWACVFLHLAAVGAMVYLFLSRG